MHPGLLPSTTPPESAPKAAATLTPAGTSPVYCFGQQPCGFFPPRYLWAKVSTARRLRDQTGGRIVFFYHDSDHDLRETQTILINQTLGTQAPFNFSCANKIERKYTPLYLKGVAADWFDKTLRRLPAYVPPEAVAMFAQNDAITIADFCLHLYRELGLLDGVEVVRSSDPEVRKAACRVDDYFVDVAHEGFVVRARARDGHLWLHAGGDQFLQLPDRPYTAEQISPARDSRLAWMQSVVEATHYIMGGGEAQYLRTESASRLVLLSRDAIDAPDIALVQRPEGGPI